ncbi:MAG TPA: phage holin family protein [Saprospiraceae bacterium]|nr:phage holin family protein [Saprospiraceae bacterium]
MDKEKSLFHKIGENYEYLKTIVDNNLELKKLELMDAVAQMVSKSIYWVVLLMIAVFALALVTFGVTLMLAQYLNSLIQALFAIAAFYFFVGILVFLLFDRIFHHTILGGIYKFLRQLDD